jgi:serine/threonine-protein kinase
MQEPRIDATTWAALNRLLDEALDLPVPERAQWIETLASEFDGIKPRLRALLARGELAETGDFLNTLPKLDLAPGDLAQASARGEQPGDEIGAYRLLRELGSGGMGVVWLAERTDGLINRPVALKLPHGAWKRAGLAERMAREREILATLTHPNIAHLYDAGLTPDGQPFLAIEYVEGRRIDVYCSEQGLDVKARLKLFAQVAKAVAYAHGKLVVHRDLKPANILVSADGQARLLDFGIAKLLDEGQAKETRATELSGRALTPDYASPEQILGEPLTIASDVYSLGVILYELLSGHRPYKLQRDSRGALEDAIVAADPAQPSDAADAASRKSLRGDLDTIVLKALKKKPAERYPTVHALLDDIERYLDARPVLAQPDSRWYRSRKFVARNKLAVSAGAAVFAAVLIGAGIAVWQARVAISEKARAEEVQAFIEAVFREADPMQSEGKLSAVDLLLQAERRLSERRDAAPVLTVQMLAIIGESLFGLQENEQSARVIEQALRLQDSMPDADPLLTARLHLALSESREMMGRVDEAVAELTKTFALLDAAGRDAGPLAVRARLHESALGMAIDDYTITERAAKQAIEEATAAIGPRSDEVAMALMFLSKSYIFTERMPEAVAPARQGLDMLLANHNGDYAHPKVIDLAPYYANALIHVGDFEAAAILMRELIGNAERVFGKQSTLVGGLSMLAIPAELERGELDAAISLAHRSLDIYLQVAQPETRVHAYRARILGQALAIARVGDEALQITEEAVRLSGNAGEPHAGRTNLGLALAHAGRLDEADVQLRLALEGTKPGTRAHMQATRYIGTVLRLRQKSLEALPWLEQSVAQTAARGFNRGEHAPGIVELGLAQLELGDIAAAQQSFTQATVALAELQQERMTPTRADLMIGIARIQLQNSAPADALRALQAVDGYWRERRPDSRWAGESALWLGRCYFALDRQAEAQVALARAVRLLATSPLPADMALVKLARSRS